MTSPPQGLRKIRIGIDVGGTFTDVVAVDAATRTIIARVKTPTTHAAEQGVAQGIIDGLRQLLQHDGIAAEDIAFIAHSTTQATNALLEGDVAKVGIIGLHGPFDFLGVQHVRVPPIPLGTEASFVLVSVHARSACDDASLVAALDALRAGGVESIAVSLSRLSVDDPACRNDALRIKRVSAGSYATAGHEVSQDVWTAGAYSDRSVKCGDFADGWCVLRSRLRRPSWMPGIGVPSMIMRSDGGVMDVREVARRPILTMLSVAAGVAGALLYENVSDGIFIEVGGTSADCSVIRRGLPQMRPARVGGHRTMLRTLDVRTLAIAGGSLVRVDPHGRGLAALRDVGPRSAHIAGLAYATFTPLEALRNARVVFVGPKAGDPEDYLALELADGTRCAPTPTCAANLLGYVPADAFAHGDRESARAAFALAGAAIGCDAESLARAVLERASKLRAAIDELVDDYGLECRMLELVGGGGGAAALVPFAAEAFGLAHRLARDAEVISPLGVALALVRDVVERTIVNPSPEDVVRVRRDAVERVIAAGASPELVETVVEIDARRNLVRATASGATAAAASGDAPSAASGDQRRAAAARALRVDVRALNDFASTGELDVFTTPAGRDALDACVVDARGVVRATVRGALAVRTQTGRVARSLERLLEDATSFGDVGRALPEVTLVYRGRVADLGTLAEPAQVLALAEEELRGLPADTPLVAVAARRSV